MGLEVEADAVDAATLGIRKAGVNYRSFAAGDVPAIVEAFSASWSADSMSARWLTTNVLLDANFDPAGFSLAVQGNRIVGAAYAVAAGIASPGLDPHGGWIPLLFVVPELRRHGLGAELVDRSLAFLRRRGAQWANVAAYGPGYLIPGADLSNAPEGAAFLLGRGFEVVEAPVSMSIDLDAYTTSGNVDELAGAAKEAGFSFSACSAGELPEVVRFAAEVTGGDWGVVLRDSVIRHGSPERIQLVRSPEGAVAGFATFGSYEGVLERFGPFGVDPAYRGRDLGKILLHQCLAAMKARRLPKAWFLWTDLDSPAGKLYAQTGFRVVRQFNVMQRPV